MKAASQSSGFRQTSDLGLHTSHVAWALVAYGLLTIAMTWPLARGLARDLPADFGDPLFNSWVLAWDAEHLLRGLAGHLDALREYWNANIYYPHPLSLAYSEHLTAQAIVILPVYAISGNPILCYNVTFLLTFVLSALGMFLLVRELTGSGPAAFLAGVVGGLFVFYLTIVDPSIFDFYYTETMLIMVIIGGPGSFWGVLGASAVLAALPDLLRFTTDLRMVLYGAVLIAAMLVFPGGVGGWLRRRGLRRWRRPHPATP